MASTVCSPLQGKDPVCQATIDKAMMDLDGTDDKSRLGANAILAVSIAVCRVCPLSPAPRKPLDPSGPQAPLSHHEDFVRCKA